MSTDFQLIGQGTYGCVYKPPIIDNYRDFITEEDNPTKHPSELISKIGDPEEMEKELDIYDDIFLVDPTYNYHYPKPILADVTSDKWPQVENVLNSEPTRCNLYRQIRRERMPTNTDFKVLVMNYGGKDMQSFSEDLFNMDVMNPNANIIAINILRHFYNLLNGVSEFVSPDDESTAFMHNDIKPNNLVYNPIQNPDEYTGIEDYMKFIDFGLSKTWTQFSTGDKGCTENWFNFPPENDFLHRDFYYHMQNLRNYAVGFQEAEIEGYLQDKLQFSVNTTWYYNFLRFSGMLNLNENERNVVLEYHHDSFKSFMRYIMDNNISYEQFIEEYFRKRDLYALGLSLLWILTDTRHIFVHNFNLRSIINNEIINFCMQLTNFNVFERYIIDDAQRDYELILSMITGLTTGGRAASLVPQVGKIDLLHSQTNLMDKKMQTPMSTEIQGPRRLNLNIFVNIPDRTGPEFQKALEERQKMNKDMDMLSYNLQEKIRTGTFKPPYKFKIPTGGKRRAIRKKRTKKNKRSRKNRTRSIRK